MKLLVSLCTEALFVIVLFAGLGQRLYLHQLLCYPKYLRNSLYFLWYGDKCFPQLSENVGPSLRDKVKQLHAFKLGQVLNHCNNNEPIFMTRVTNFVSYKCASIVLNEEQPKFSFIIIHSIAASCQLEIFNQCFDPFSMELVVTAYLLNVQTLFNF